ncbi:MAG: GTP-binding protein [Lachnospiraceae bacterium]|nr:GTP-binding protein [Lachnospiraceae bacterium]
MTRIDVVSGFLGAGKTTLIKKLLKDAVDAAKTVLIENEFGEIGIDGGFLEESGIEIKEMNQGCICCSLVGDFGTSLKEVIETYSPERILIEPSGVGKLSDVLKAIERVAGELDVKINSAVAVVDASKAKMYSKNFGEFFVNQIEYAGTVILSRTDTASAEKIAEAVAIVKEHNPKATVITTTLDQLDAKAVLDAIEGNDSIDVLLAEMMEKAKEAPEHHHHHHHDHDDHDEECCHHHHHDDDDDDDHECCCHHHHDDDDDDDHEHHHHHHHHGHDADEIFTSWGMESPVKFSAERIESILKALDSGEYGVILRAKGMVPAEDGTWIYYDYVPEETNVRTGKPQVTGKICVIGSELKEDKLKELFA